MLVSDLLAERLISEAIERGELDGLPGAGRPLELDDDRLVPEEWRVAWRILKNAGFVPPEVEARRELADLERLVLRAAPDDVPARAKTLKKIALLKARIECGYEARVLGKLGA